MKFKNMKHYETMALELVIKKAPTQKGRSFAHINHYKTEQKCQFN